MKRNQVLGKFGRGSIRAVLLATAPVVLVLPTPSAAWAQTQSYSFDIASQPLGSALLSLGRQADVSMLAATLLVEGKTGPAVRGQMTLAAALDLLLEDTGLAYVFVQSNAVRIIAKDHAQNGLPSTILPAGKQLADESPGDSGRDNVIITGTNIRGARPASSRVDTYTAKDIQKSGAVTTEQFAAKIPQNLGTFSQYAPGASTAGANADAVSSVDLRGLGVGTTLTLVNGRRVSLSNGGRSADISLIPAAALERVEVLTDGASAIYGSDAIGGVINFILRD
ncbi:MAG: TonB-dependent receptor, partial [Burkholderiales bacterium]